jgi:hypothetical protein
MFCFYFLTITTARDGAFTLQITARNQDDFAAIASADPLRPGAFPFFMVCDTNDSQPPEALTGNIDYLGHGLIAF